MNRFDIINRIGDKYRVGNTETGEFSYAQALKTVGKDIKDYQKATTGTQHKFLDIRFENERLVDVFNYTLCTYSKYYGFFKNPICTKIQIWSCI